MPAPRPRIWISSYIDLSEAGDLEIRLSNTLPNSYGITLAGESGGNVSLILADNPVAALATIHALETALLALKDEAIARGLPGAGDPKGESPDAPLDDGSGTEYIAPPQ